MLDLEEKIGQMIIVGFDGLEPPGYLLDWLDKGRVGGVILFSRNIEDKEQVIKLTDRLRQAAKMPPLIAIDQEGGVVSRLREGFTESPGAMALGTAGSAELAEEVSYVLGKEMLALGINWNLAPVLDLTHDISNPSVGTRSLGADPLMVAELGAAQVRGFQKSGVAATGKHFPGKANTPIDPHVELPVIDSEVDDIWDTDLVPFRMAIGQNIAAVMITHVKFTCLDRDYPSTLSQKVIQGLLRRDLGFRGLITTDCMEMKAITNHYNPGESAVTAAQAGASVVLFSHTREYQEDAYDALHAAALSGRLPMERIDYAVRKVTEMKKRFRLVNPPPIEIVSSSKHLELMAKASRLGTVMLKNNNILPLKNQSTLVIEFASPQKGAAPQKNMHTYLLENIQRLLENVKVISLDSVHPSEESISNAESMLPGSDVVVVATRNAHIRVKQRETAESFLEKKKRSVLVCLRNPYDAGVLKSEAVLCTCGDSRPSLMAAVEALCGQFKPEGKLPVPVSLSLPKAG